MKASERRARARRLQKLREDAYERVLNLMDSFAAGKRMSEPNAAEAVKECERALRGVLRLKEPTA